MTETDPLVAFLNARLDEDEAQAKTAATVAGPAWQFGRDFPTSYLLSDSGAILADTLLAQEGQIGPHIARHDPARVLREVAAKRAMLARYGSLPAVTNLGEHLQRSQEQAGLYYAIRLLAAIWSDHPDYQPEWKTP